MPVPVTRLPLQLKPDPERVICRLFCPGDVKRSREIFTRVESFPEEQVEQLLSGLERDFHRKHADLLDVFAEHYEEIRKIIGAEPTGSRPRQLLIGAYFTMDYALEAVALFNPSIVPAILQDDVPAGSIRFLMSLRATGEGHVSSIVFRTGLIGALRDVQFDPPGRYSMRHGIEDLRLVRFTESDGSHIHDEPWRVIGQTREPLLVPTDQERDGYVPNVVYSCGAMVHNGPLIVPYAISDLSTSVARIELDALLAELDG